MTNTTKHGNRYDTGPTVAVTSGDYRAAWNDGHFSGDPELIRLATLAATEGLPVDIRGREVIADNTTPLGALAAFWANAPGRTVVIEAPQDVLDFLAQGDCSPATPEQEAADAEA